MLEDFTKIVKARRATRHFTPRPLPDRMLDQLLDAARWAPSGYNLQPTHFVVVTDADRRAPLRAACMDQQQITEAAAVVVFCGDKLVARNHFEAALAADRQAGAIAPDYEKVLRRYVPLAFNVGPLGLGWLAKALLPLLAGWFVPVPSIPAVHRRYWLSKQASLAAMTFMLAATAAGLATCPVEGFDERRVRKALGIPRSVVPVVVVPVGYSATPQAIKTRLPLECMVHRQRWRRPV